MPAVLPITLALADTTATQALGIALGKLLLPGDVLLLQGDLGSGKTTLVQGLGLGLGITEPIVSPTFILLNEYSEARIPLYHLDLYRLDPAEVDTLHIEAYWEGWEFPAGIVAIEWAERLPYKPSRYLSIALSATEAGGRQATLIPVGDWSETWDAVVDQLAGFQ